MQSYWIVWRCVGLLASCQMSNTKPFRSCGRAWGHGGLSIFACWWAWPSPVQAPALQYHYARPLQRRGLACTMWSTMGNCVCIWYVSGLSLVCRSVGQTTNSAPASGLSLVCQGGPPLVCQWSVSGLSLVCQFLGLSNDLIVHGYSGGARACRCPRPHH